MASLPFPSFASLTTPRSLLLSLPLRSLTSCLNASLPRTPSASLPTPLHLAKDHVMPVQMRRGHVQDEELGVLCVGAVVGHGEHASGGVREVEVLVLEVGAVDAVAPVPTDRCEWNVQRPLVRSVVVGWMYGAGRPREAQARASDASDGAKLRTPPPPPPAPSPRAHPLAYPLPPTTTTFLMSASHNVFTTRVPPAHRARCVIQVSQILCHAA